VNGALVLRWSTAMLTGIALVGCSSSAADATCSPVHAADGGLSAVPEPFLAFAEDFHGYHDWKSFDVTEDADLVGIHDGSKVIEYINNLPPTGSTTFPVGTIIVKEATGGTQAHELFAMVKRGAGYNPGIPGWEWMEIGNLGDGCDRARIVWRGVGPPAGETYGGDPNAGCNTCHTACGNDGVCAKPLNLANF
jgi:hypothetical protein